MSKHIAAWKVLVRGCVDVAGAFASMPKWYALSHEINHRHSLGDDFFGVSIATSDDISCDDAVVDYLRDLNINHVRLDYSYCSQGGNTQRLLDRVIAEGFDVMLDIFPAPEEAGLLAKNELARSRWLEFVKTVFKQYAGKVRVFEIGNTPNRTKWSGFDAVNYLTIWQIAAEAAQAYSLKLAGPNISGFEPCYNVALLKAMKSLHSVPAIHSSHIFVEHGVQPEAFRGGVLGRYLTQLLNLNRVKKARITAEIASTQSCLKSIASYKCWSSKHITESNAESEQKNADYLVRHLVTAAASSALDRVYWGPLIGHQDALVDCGERSALAIDDVSFYKTVNGPVADFKLTGAYRAFKFLARFIRDVNCLQGVNAENGINHFVFESDNGAEIHVVWTLDCNAIRLSQLYSVIDLDGAEFLSITGELLSAPPAMITESPLIIRWPKLQSFFNSRGPSVDDVRLLDNLNGVVFLNTPKLQSVATRTPHWQGVVVVPIDADIDDTLAIYHPDTLKLATEVAILRNSHNRLWNVHLDQQDETLQTVKLYRTRGVNKITGYFMVSKGRRHWNNAIEMLRVGVNTPQPLAFFERHKNSGIENSYYLCQFVPNAFSAADVFAAFNNGEDHYKGITKQAMFEQLAALIAQMHNCKILHQNLSAQHLIMTLDNDQLTCYLVDLGRARLNVGGQKGAQLHHRFSDLQRLCDTLSWPDREAFIDAYWQLLAKPKPRAWRILLRWYELKQQGKTIINKRLTSDQ